MMEFLYLDTYIAGIKVCCYIATQRGQEIPPVFHVSSDYQLGGSFP